MSLEPLAPRSDFPALADNELAYLDNAATTQKPQVVIDAITASYARGSANIGRGVYAWAERVTGEYEAARAKLAAFVGAKTQQLVFTSGTTEALNLVAQGWARVQLDPGDRIVCTPLEHHANFLPWQSVAKACGASFELIAADERGALDLDDAAVKLDGARLLAVSASSNVLGAVPQLESLLKLARELGVCTVLDAAQAVAHQPLDFVGLGCDFMAFSGHKMLGPTGIGALVGRRERLVELEPVRLGGGMVVEVGTSASSWRELPARLEGGTPNIAGAVGLAAAVDYLEGIGRSRIATHEGALVERLVEGLSTRGATVVGAGGSIASFTFAPHHPHDVAGLLDERGVAVRAGLHCAQPLHRHLGLHGTIRASVAPYCGSRDIEALLAGLDHVNEVLG